VKRISSLLLPLPPLLVLLPLLQVLGCRRMSAGPGETPAPTGPDRPNILLFDIDTLRSDRIDEERSGSYVAPNLHELALEGVRFTTMIAQSGWTLPSLGALLSSRSPVLMELGQEGLPWAWNDARPLPEILGYYGYSTTAFWGRTLPASHSIYSTGFANVDKGVPGKTTAIDGTVADWLAARPQEPFFAFVHDIDLHMAIPPIPEAFLHRYSGALDGCPLQPLSRVALDLQDTIGKERAQAHAIDHYDGSVAWYDAVVGRIVQVLESTGLAKRTVVIVTSDHGEDLYDNLGLGHGTLFDVVLKVPLIVVDPRIEARGARIDTQVQTIDLAPTILARVGIPVDVGMEGQSLLPLLGFAGGSYEERDVFSMSNHYNASIRSPPYKLLTIAPNEDYAEGPLATHDSETAQGQPVVHLFDVAADPGEHDDLVSKLPSVREDLLLRLNAWVQARRDAQQNTGWEPLTERQRQTLQAQGYWSLIDPNGKEGAGRDRKGNDRGRRDRTQGRPRRRPPPEERK
jgi:arylsulfatase A-like enzyme